MLHALLQLFYPAVCAGCDELLYEHERVICTKCRHELPLTQHHLQPQNEATAKFYGRVPIEHAVAFAYYHPQGIVRKMIHALKYSGNEEIGTVIGLWFAHDLLSIATLRPDFIVAVPLHSRKHRQRGFNQVHSFGKALSTAMSLPFHEKLLIRNFYSKTQTKKNLLGRSELHKSLFEANFTQEHHGKHFLLIDDVMTTGATLEACSRALLKIPGAKISIACMAFSHS